MSLVLPLVGMCFGIFWAGAFIVSWTYVPMVRVWHRNNLHARWRHNQRLIRRLFYAFCQLARALRLVDVRPIQYSVEQTSGASVLLVNHPSLFDVVALLATYENICCVVKESVYHGILVGPLLRDAGYICGGRGQTSRVSEILRDGIDRLDKGHRVLIFPEGTRSPAQGLHKFQRSGFEMAARAQVPAQIAHIHCHPPLLRKGKPWHDFPGPLVRYEITELATLTIKSGRNNVRSAMKQVHDQLSDFRAGGRHS